MNDRAVASIVELVRKRKATIIRERSPLKVFSDEPAIGLYL